MAAEKLTPAQRQFALERARAYVADGRSAAGLDGWFRTERLSPGQQAVVRGYVLAEHERAGKAAV